MRIGAIDTTTKFLCVAICDNSKLYTCNLELGTRHSLLLVITIKRALDALGLRLKDIDYFACGLGPGSFTGIRVGLSTIKGFAWALEKPIVGISTLDIIARNALFARFGFEDKKERNVIIPAVDARRNLIYCSGYRIVSGALKRIMPYMLLTEQEFLKKIKPGSVILGDALGLYKESIMHASKGVALLDHDYWYPQAHAMVPLVKERIASGKIDDAFKIKPIYLYPKECQIRKY